jgi:hypothetical protein
LEEKIGQMVQIDRSVASADVMNKYFIGKFFLKLSFNLKRCSSVICINVQKYKIGI